ncbi:MAG: InlB B-repeat-containing protein, partial [Flavobacteriales bacterium]|nr:InlB B-repeat-containing protein [Flavobacteriales bacterium]
MKMQRIFTALLLAIILVLNNVSSAMALPPLPSSFFGTVKLDGANVPIGTLVSARINGVQYASVAAFLDGTDTVYFFDVPGDDPATAGTLEGGVQNDVIQFYIGGVLASQTGTWLTGTNAQVNLTATTPRTVTFNPNGGSGSMSPQIANVPTALTLNTFTRTGYSFAGWNTATNGSGTAYANGATYDFSTDVTLYAQWSANSYTVTFNANGGSAPSPANKQVTFGSTYGTLATTSRTGYTFVGWFTAASGGTQVTTSTVVSNASDHTLYAQWSANTYTVTFNAKGGSAPSPANKQVTFGS